MPLAFQSLNQGIITFGFFNIDTDTNHGNLVVGEENENGLKDSLHGTPMAWSPLVDSTNPMGYHPG